MEDGLMAWTVRADLWAAAAAMAVFASYVALDLARGASSRNRFTIGRSVVASALALSAGGWAAHFISMAGEPLKFAVGYQGWLVTVAMGVAVLLSVVAVQISSRPGLGTGGVLIAAAFLGLSACAVPALSLSAMSLSPSPRWSPLHIGAGGLLAFVSASLALFVVSFRGRTGKPLGLPRQALVALGLGACITIGNTAMLQAAGISVSAISLASNRVSVGTMTVLASLGVPALLALLLMTSVIETHFRKMLWRTREEMKRVAQTDRLTELPNRGIFEETLQGSAIRADKNESHLALLFVNIDGLKAVNESFGQAIGDSVLREVGKRLRGMCGPHDMVARAGGDEFLILIDNDATKDDAAQMANRVLGSMNELARLGDHEISMSCTIGVAMYPEHGNPSNLIAHAAAAMQAAKRLGGASHSFFEDRMVAGVREQLEMLQDLRRAIAHKELELYFQPKIHAPSGEITGAEALMRWKHPQRGLVGPAIFIPLAERYGLINAMGNWLIEEACRQIRAWRDQKLRMRVAINLSVHQLRQSDLVERIAEALKRYHIEPSLLTCEITESAAMEDMRVTMQVLDRLAAVGVHLSIDDFGTGYSSLSYLRQLPSQELKIDRSFVCDLETSADARAIVDAVVKLAQALGLKVVAEGVETEEQQEILRQLGCHELQGYLFAKPMPPDALALWAMNDEGPRALGFRASLFGDTMPMAQ